MKNTYNVKNRSASMVVYHIAELNIRREFAPGETKKIPYDELEKLTYQAGGRELIAGFLQIEEEEVTSNLNVTVENEYYMSEEQVVELLKSGSLDAFLDCLDYAPLGVMQLVQQYAVSLPLTDTQKIHALKEKTGFDAEKALENAKAAAEPEDEAFKTTTAPAAATPTAPTGRRTTSNYKVVSKPKAE